ncbi:hypothetical protein RIF29_14071 [Crotalaria pallida]|uniref:Uncharacterized protein n=1 Tax=Crotalaria pallida TaxID=3830 RepID=A0AAN9IDG3_CROPI
MGKVSSELSPELRQLMSTSTCSSLKEEADDLVRNGKSLRVSSPCGKNDMFDIFEVMKKRNRVARRDRGSKTGGLDFIAIQESNMEHVEKSLYDYLWGSIDYD